jgi:hypothetical protein
MLLAFPIFFDLVLVHPVYVDYIPAKDIAVCDFCSEPFHKFVRIFPHTKIGTFVACASSEHQAYHCKTSDKGAAGLTVRAQSSAEGIHCFQHIFIYIFAKLFLPDRKNRLASMEKPVKYGACLFLHFRRIHKTSFVLFVAEHDARRERKSPSIFALNQFTKYNT